VNRVRREIPIGLGDGDGAIKYIVGLHGVGDIDHVGGRIDVEDDTLHGADVVVSRAKVGGKRNNALFGQDSLEICGMKTSDELLKLSMVDWRLSID
jgi:hypothetical protein